MVSHLFILKRNSRPLPPSWVSILSTRAKELQERIRSMKNSWSWCLTYPLRVLDESINGRKAATKPR